MKSNDGGNLHVGTYLRRLNCSGTLEHSPGKVSTSKHIVVMLFGNIEMYFSTRCCVILVNW